MHKELETFKKEIEIQEKMVYEKIAPIQKLYDEDKITKKEAIDKLIEAFYDLEKSDH